MKKSGIEKMTIEQVKAARALLNWTSADLAENAGVGAATVRRYEAGNGVLPKATNAICDALENAGIQFIPENGGGAGVRLKRPSD